MKKKGCAFKIRTWDILESSVLALLLKNPAHGYSLIEKISEFGISPLLLDQGVIYRILRNLESKGFIVFEWETEGSGAAKKVYKITDAGKSFLKKYVKREKEKIKSLDRIMNKIEEMLNSGETDDEKKD